MAGLGDFAGGFASGFTNIWQAKSEKDRQDKIAKLQGQLLELQLKGQEGQQAALEQLKQMASGSVGPINVGTKTVKGRERPDMQFTGRDSGLLAALSDPEGQLAALQAGVLQAKDLIGSGSQRISADLQMLQAAGLDPKSPQVQQAILNKLGGGEGKQVDLLKDMIALQAARLDLSEAQRDFDKNTRQAGTDQAISTFSVESIAKNGSEAVKIMQELEGTPLAVGTNFAGSARDIQSLLAAGGGALGFDTGDLKDQIAKRDRLDKLFGQILQKRVDRMTAGGTQMTDAKLEGLQRISPDINKRPEANALLLADYFEEELAIADAEGTPIPGKTRTDMLEFIVNARKAGVAQSEPLVDVAGAVEGAGDQIAQISQMTIGQVNALAGRAAELPPEIRQALADRWEELNGQRHAAR